MDPLDIIEPVDPPDVIRRRCDLYFDDIVGTLKIVDDHRHKLVVCGSLARHKTVEKYLSSFQNAVFVLGIINRDWLTTLAKYIGLVYRDDMNRYWSTVHRILHAYPRQFCSWTMFFVFEPMPDGIIGKESIPYPIEPRCEGCGQHINGDEETSRLEAYFYPDSSCRSEPVMTDWIHDRDDGWVPEKYVICAMKEWREIWVCTLKPAKTSSG